MKYRKLTSEGDMQFGHGLSDFHIDNRYTVAQSILTRLKLWKGEWYLDTEDGTPYYQKILDKNTLSTATVALYDRIKKTDGVIEIVDFQATENPDTREVKFEITVNTIFGEVSVNG